MTSATFDQKADAQRFSAEMETDKFRGTWIDPRHAEVPLAQWFSGVPRVGPPAVSEHPADLPA